MLRKELKNLQIGQQKFSKLKGESEKVGTIELSKLHAIGIQEEGRENGEKNILINSNYRHQNIDKRSSENLKKDKYQCTCTHKHASVHITLKLLKTKEKEIIKGSFRKETPSVRNKVKNWNKVKNNSGFIRNKASQKAIE